MHFSKYLAKFFAIALLSVFVMSCGKDDNNNTVTPEKEDVATKVAGKYNGKLNFMIENLPGIGKWEQTLENYVLVLTKENAEEVKVTYGPINISVQAGPGQTMSYELPAFTDKAKVGKDGDSYKLEGTINAKVNGVVHGAEKELVVSGSVVGPIKDGKAELKLNIKMGNMPFPLQATYVAEIVK